MGLNIERVDPLRQKEATCESIRENAAFNVPYMTMTVLATVVACYGLLENSAAVVIGAMISPCYWGRSPE